MTENKYYIKTELKERGWTESIIKKMNLTPDLLKQNPRYNNAPKMKLYLIDSIKSLENTEQFTKLIEKSKLRKISSKKAVETKRKKIINYVENLKITIPKIPLKELKEKSIESYDGFQSYKLSNYNNYEPNFYEPSENNSEFLKRIQVNYLRHQLTNYEKELEEIFGKTGKYKAYKILKNKILNEIIKQYPKLKKQCENQKLME